MGRTFTEEEGRANGPQAVLIFRGSGGRFWAGSGSFGPAAARKWS